MRLVLLIRSLGRGGAERQLALLARGLAGRHQVTVLTYYANRSGFETEVDAAVDVRAIGKAGRWDFIGFGVRTLAAFRDLKPDVVYAFLSTGSLVSLLARVAHPAVKLVWGLRTAQMDFERFDTISRWARDFERRLSGCADLMIANAEAGRAQALREGFRPRRIEVIHNGIDTERFVPDPVARRALRGDLDLDEATPLVGIVARFDPMKGLEVFLDAASQCARMGYGWRFIVIGSGDTAYRDQLQRRAAELALGEVLVWRDGTAGVEHLYPALDVMTSVSHGEGFSNVIAEAMACGVPCVVTDVGESAFIVGTTGAVVPPGETTELVSAWSTMLARLESESATLRGAARARVVDLFSVGRMVDATESGLLELMRT